LITFRYCFETKAFLNVTDNVKPKLAKTLPTSLRVCLNIQKNMRI
jgi:hypothetical protein